MKVIITESQFYLLTESVEGLDEFKTLTLAKYPEVIEYWDVIENFIRKSECKRIEVGNLKIGIAASLTNGVIFSKNIFIQPLTHFLFTIFHEIAHQYQYKKYGIDKMTSFYSNDLPIEDAAKFMYDTEVVADEFATRKLRELQKYGYLQNLQIPKGYYKLTPLKQFESLIRGIKLAIPQIKNEAPEKITEILYNWIKANVNENI
jgi:hypothetical protein